MTQVESEPLASATLSEGFHAFSDYCGQVGITGMSSKP